MSNSHCLYDIANQSMVCTICRCSTKLDLPMSLGLVCKMMKGFEKFHSKCKPNKEMPS